MRLMSLWDHDLLHRYTQLGSIRECPKKPIPHPEELGIILGILSIVGEAMVCIMMSNWSSQGQELEEQHIQMWTIESSVIHHIFSDAIECKQKQGKWVCLCEHGCEHDRQWSLECGINGIDVDGSSWCRHPHRVVQGVEVSPKEVGLVLHLKVCGSYSLRGLTRWPQ